MSCNNLQYSTDSNGGMAGGAAGIAHDRVAWLCCKPEIQYLFIFCFVFCGITFFLVSGPHLVYARDKIVKKKSQQYLNVNSSQQQSQVEVEAVVGP